MHGFRRYELRRAAFKIAFFGAFLWAGSAAAQEAIGGAKVIENDVRGETARATAQIHRGDQVFQSELVRTAAASLAQLALRDETNVSLGPSSQIKLDRFVYDGSGSTAKKVVLDASKGAFRFFSGNSAHDAYQVTTPQASIGVRGTIYDVRIEPGRTRIVLQDGALHACIRGNTRLCRDLTEPGTSLVISARGIEGPFPPAQKAWDFGDQCGRQPSLCARTTIAGLDLSVAKTRTQLASLPGRAGPRRPAPPKTGKRPVRRRHPGRPSYGDEGGDYVPPVVTGPPVVPVIPLLGGFGGFRGGFRGGRDRRIDSPSPLR